MTHPTPSQSHFIITGRNEVVAKVMFLHVSVILSTGGVSGRENPPARRHPPRQGEPPTARRTPRQVDPPQAGRPPRQGDPQAGRPPAGRPPLAGRPPGRETPWARRPSSRETPPGRGDPPGRETPQQGDPPWHTVNERPVRILLECILVISCSFRKQMAKIIDSRTPLWGW